MSDNPTNVLLEQIIHQNQAVLEIVGEMQKQLSDVPKRDEFIQVKNDIQTIKTAVTATNSDLHEL